MIDLLRAQPVVAAIKDQKLDAFRMDAVISLLMYWFTAVSPEETKMLAADPKAFTVIQNALRLVPKLDASHRERFFLEVVLGTEGDPDLRPLASVLLAAFDDRALEPLLNKALSDATPKRRRNLLAVCDYAVWHDDKRLLALRPQLRSLAEQNKRDPIIGPVARSVKL